MRKLLSISLFLLVLHTTYYDLTTGTLATPVVSVVDKPIQKETEPFIIYQVKAGDTVLSLVEKANGTIPVSIDTIVHDFETLNEIPPNRIQIGKKYRIPTY
ncbi:LysM peptidoglycan-binding domain-containing protein [Pseudalkalibacillus hwajinpoensis]|uniref:LysM peptidoglycan-binding domain-containing protein n=1 Tax=Guptibacillus hwajinpoensis TaxID=208199 RepID=A0A4U1MGT1_9BACL|nr:LysM domain-containing protein [Pseudalkalibacillus hwajinpoensis]TKD70143.1 LysM peptidoglycan-binding domain-containing protein [Pseudalkalibacillus hwajinpoensis]